MGRAMAGVVIVAILAGVVLVIWLTHRRGEVRRGQLRELQRINRQQWDLIAAIKAEAQTQMLAGNTSHDYTFSLIAEHERKELTA